jgi:hypothetical protein
VLTLRGSYFERTACDIFYFSLWYFFKIDGQKMNEMIGYFDTLILWIINKNDISYRDRGLERKI